MANYIQGMNQLITAYAAKVPGACLYGQNLNNGTFISGLTKNLVAHPSGRIVNTGNCENTLCGAGFGMMLGGVSSIYFVKQLDFMLLGLDHFVNTYSFIRGSRDLSQLGSFTIILLTCDQGMQGSQSSVNSLGDYASLARVPCFSLTNSADAEHILRTQLTAPGFRIIALNMRHFRAEFLQMNALYASEDSALFQYSEGDGATIVCFNFSVPEGLAVQKEFAASGIQTSLFSAQYAPAVDWGRVKQSVARTKKLVILDDSKSVHLPCYKLLDELHQDGLSFRRTVVTRQEIVYTISPEQYPVDSKAIVARLS
jgi:pyruvate dehydrogenase E1 component beta subunit